MSDEQNKALMRQVAFFARARGKAKPTSQEGWKVLLAEYLAHKQAEAAAMQSLPSEEEHEVVGEEFQQFL